MKLSFFIAFLLFIIIIFSSCSFKKGENKNQSEDDLDIKNYSYINVIMENDTLDTKLEKGFIKFFYRIPDTLKLSSNDERSVFVIFALKSEDKNNKGIEAGGKIEKELNFIPVNPNDTILIPFIMKPNFSGKGVIVGVLTDMYKLHSYDKEKVRVLTFDNTFVKDVYIK